MKFTRNLKRNRRCFGLTGILLALRELTTSDALRMSVFSRHMGRPIILRLNTTDIAIYDQIFVLREYAFPIAIEPKVIVDAGANIGLSAIYYAQRFPAAKIYALEPERSNFDLMVMNVAPFANVIPIEKALWNETTELEIFDPGPGRAGFQKDGFQTFKSDSLECHDSNPRVAAVDLDSLMHDCHIDHIDLLKVDIEGAEREVFKNAGEWLNKVSIITIELHDRLRPGCSRAFYNATNHFELEAYKGENVIVARRDCMTADSPLTTGAAAHVRSDSFSRPEV